jgi:hypothetical protein
MTVKVWTFLITTLLLVTGCSKSEVVTTYEQEVAKQDYSKQQPAQQEVNNNPVPIIFDASIGEQATTRTLTPEEAALLKLKSTGFGVFTYYTNGAYPASNSNSTSEATDVAPNFMYNQSIYWDDDTDAWAYTPIKYWPNDFSTGAVDNQDPAATGSSNDKLSFFAYAPFTNQVALDATTYTLEPSSGRFKNGSNYYDQQPNASGVLEFKPNSTASDPKLHYRLGGAATLDLVYASALKDKTKNSGTPPAVYTPSFSFNHALSALKFYVGAYFDETPSLSPSIQIADDTYITIESVEISSDDMPYDGWLNLNSGNWEDTSSSTASITVNESELNTDLQYTSTDTAEWDDDEGIFVKTGSWHPGVGRNSDGTKAAAGTTYTLMKQVGGLDQYAMIMPSATSVTYKITCNYHVWTLDKRNADCISKVENNVTNEISFTPAKGNVYAITIWLGMTTVKLDVKQYNNGTTGNEHWPTSAEQAGGNNIMWN